MRKVALIFCAFFLPFTFSHAGTITPRLEYALSQFESTDNIEIIVYYKNKFDLFAYKKANERLNRSKFRSSLIIGMRQKHRENSLATEALGKKMGARNLISLWAANALAMTIPAGQVSKLASHPSVQNVDLNTVITLADPIPATQAPSEWNLIMIKADAVWKLGYTGEGVTVANMDTGVDVNHADLALSYRGGTNSWFDPYGQNATPTDKNGHGTGTMSLIVGSNTGGSNIGVAPGAKWIAAKIFNNVNQATTVGIHQAFDWLLDPDGDPQTDDAPDVVNGSWAFDVTNICDNTFSPDILALRTANIAYAFSAGNAGPNPSTSVSPANNDISYAVGAVDQAMGIASYSSRGPSTCNPSNVYPHTVAPGSYVKMADLTSNGAIPNAYTYGAGTSFAAPHVAGAMALIKGAYPTVTVTELENAVNSTAFDILNPGIDSDSGYGLLNARDAFFSLPVDTDGDGVYDGNDNCILLANSDQYDSDGDGYGNRCDADLNNSGGPVNTADYLMFRQAFGTTNLHADFNYSGIVNTADYLIFRQLFAAPPGPSGLVR